MFRRLLYDGWPPGGDLSKGTETKMRLVSRLFPKCLLGRFTQAWPRTEHRKGFASAFMELTK